MRDLRPGQIVCAARPTTVRTRGNGNLKVDVPRGRPLRVAALRGEVVILEPSPPDADLLRQFGVRKIPRYSIRRSQVEADFLPEEEWKRQRDQEVSRIRERWPALTVDQVERILLGDPWIGMTKEQAEAAVGGVLFSREERDTSDGKEEVWRIGRRPRSAELAQFTEGRERGIKARTFEEYLVLKTRALLRFRDSLLVAIEAPPAGG